jgi:tRNA pseudouridine38-40 synthase
MRYALLIAYDGTDFAGWWRQPGQRTVAGVFDQAFARLGEPQAAVVGTSRTDAGVHAEGQVAHVDTLRSWSPAILLAALNQHLPADTVCRQVSEVPETWDACHHAVMKTYRYSLDAGSVADPFCARFAWRTPFRLSLDALQSAADGIAGERDWRGFSKRGETRHLDGDLVRRIDSVAWSHDGARLICHVRGGGFTFRLVRSLVGAMVAVAHGTCTPAELAAALRGEDSSAGMQQAPAHGLCLEHILHTPSPGWIRREGRAPARP